MTKTKHTGVYYRETKNKERVYYITYSINKKFKQEKVGTAKEGMTVAYASKIRSKRTSVDRLKDDAPMMLYKKLPTFDEAFDEYYSKIEGKSDAENTRNRYKLHIQKTFGHLKLDDISIGLLEDFKKHAKKKKSLKTGRAYAPKTINDWLNIINTVFNYMIQKHGFRLENPAHSSKLERDKIDNDRERYLEIGEIKQLWKELENRVGSNYKEGVTDNMKVFLALALSTGARLGSILTISKADVNLKTNTIIIKNHKANRTYNGYLHPKYKEIIEERMRNLSPIDYLVSNSNVQMHRSSMSKVFSKVFDKIFNEGLDKWDSKRRVVIHTLRHTFASQLAIQGTPIYTIMRLMDHADISQTIRYAKLSPDSAKENVFSLNI